MFIRIGCVDGNIYESNVISEAELQADLDENNGYIGTGSLKDSLVLETVDEFVDYLSQMLTGSVDGSKTTHISLEMGQRKRTFVFDKIVWSEIIRDAKPEGVAL